MHNTYTSALSIVCSYDLKKSNCVNGCYFPLQASINKLILQKHVDQIIN